MENLIELTLISKTFQSVTYKRSGSQWKSIAGNKTTTEIYNLFCSKEYFKSGVFA